MNDSPVLFVSAGMLRPKKKDHPFARQHYYLNYGLLGLASILHQQGLIARMIHGRFSSPEEVLERVSRQGLLEGSRPIFLSIPSCFAISWSAEFVRLLKARIPGKRVVVGGRWVVGDDGDWIRERIPGVDLVVFGTAESRIRWLVDESNWEMLGGTDRVPGTVRDSEPPELDYGILTDYEMFQPSLEVSRGCGMGCSFCAEKNAPLTGLRSPKALVNSLLALQSQYFRRKVHPYFECSFFRPTLEWASKLHSAQIEYGVNMQWRSESRVDSFTDATLSMLAKTGLKVLDLGLESASTTQLRAMNKSMNPEIYLHRASRVVERCAELGIWVKINILLYAGETLATVAETEEWLERHKGAIKGVSVNPLIVYRAQGVGAFVAEIGDLGSRLADPTGLERQGFSFVHLSGAIEAEHALQLSTEIAQRHMSALDYYDLKSFSYFPDGFTYEQFLAIARNCDSRELPFRVDDPAVEDEGGVGSVLAFETRSPQRGSQKDFQ